MWGSNCGRVATEAETYEGGVDGFGSYSTRGMSLFILSKVRTGSSLRS